MKYSIEKIGLIAQQVAEGAKQVWIGDVELAMRQSACCLVERKLAESRFRSLPFPPRCLTTFACTLWVTRQA